MAAGNRLRWHGLRTRRSAWSRREMPTRECRRKPEFWAKGRSLSILRQRADALRYDCSGLRRPRTGPPQGNSDRCVNDEDRSPLPVPRNIAVCRLDVNQNRQKGVLAGLSDPCRQCVAAQNSRQGCLLELSRLVGARLRCRVACGIQGCASGLHLWAHGREQGERGGMGSGAPIRRGQRGRGVPQCCDIKRPELPGSRTGVVRQTSYDDVVCARDVLRVVAGDPSLQTGSPARWRAVRQPSPRSPRPVLWGA